MGFRILPCARLLLILPQILIKPEKTQIKMGGFFGTVSVEPCIADVFYGTDYHSHLGTRRGGIATYNGKEGFKRSIHNLENSYFRTKFEDGLEKFAGN